MDRINGKAITIKAGGKLFAGLSDVDWSSAAKIEESLIKEDNGNPQREVITFDDKFSLSGIVGIKYTAGVKQKETVQLTGVSGTANIVNCGGLTKLVTYATSLTATAAAFVTSWAAAYLAVGIVVTSAVDVITFEANVAGVPFAPPVIANVTTNLSGTVTHLVANQTDETGTHNDWSALRAAYRAKTNLDFVYGMFVTGKPEIQGHLLLTSLSEKTSTSGKATYSAEAIIVQDSSLTFATTP